MAHQQEVLIAAAAPLPCCILLLSYCTPNPVPLPSLPLSPLQVKQLMAHQQEALIAAEKLKRAAGGKDESKLHRQLRVIQGTAANKRLLSSRGAQTRPMMEKVGGSCLEPGESAGGTCWWEGVRGKVLGGRGRVSLTRGKAAGGRWKVLGGRARAAQGVGQRSFCAASVGPRVLQHLRPLCWRMTRRPGSGWSA